MIKKLQLILIQAFTERTSDLALKKGSIRVDQQRQLK
jgi:hypothetical protein